jgi:hypothetical protein
MTGHERLRHDARRLLLIQFLPLVPILFGVLVTIGGPRHFGALGAWFHLYWWVFGVTLGLIYVVIGIITSYLLRCPWCTFRFQQASIENFAFVVSEPPIRFCPHCGTSLSRKLGT